MEKTVSPLLRLPTELIQQILSFLSPIDLADVAGTCRVLYSNANDDALWLRHVQENLPGKTLLKPPLGWTFRQMYLAHTPYWFIPRYKIWFSDAPHHGKLIIGRYSISRRAIEAYTLVAHRGNLELEFWDYNPDVIIHTFKPKVHLHLDQPILTIYPASARNFPADNRRFQREIYMDTHPGPAGAAILYSRLVLCRSLPESAISPQTQFWPPLKLPAVQRTRNQSLDNFKSSGHRPLRLSEISEYTFRLRKWMEFRAPGAGLSMRMGEDVNTYATLAPEAYTPTPAKPWRGIWVGDYAGHGCEFLAILQPDNPVKLPDEVTEMWHRTRGEESSDSEESWQTADSHSPANGAPDPSQIEWMSPSIQAPQPTLLSAIEENSVRDIQTPIPVTAEDVTEGSSTGASKRARHARRPLSDDSRYSGQLLGVKLTGDPNVPRGEYTFLAPDLGPDGTIRIAHEEIFRGARVIRSCGHAASTGFIDDMYIPSQLILISENRIAQYWEAFGHISFYLRVDIDQLTRCD